MITNMHFKRNLVDKNQSHPMVAMGTLDYSLKVTKFKYN